MATSSLIAQQNDTVDALCWRYYGRTAGAVEAVLTANPGLAAMGPVLPMGTRVAMPDAPAATRAPSIDLWT